MNDPNNQAVVDGANAVAQPTADASNAQEPTLEQLLDEYDRSVQRPQAQPEPVQQQPYIPDAPATLPPEIKYMQEKMFMDDVRKSLKAIAGDSKIPEDAALGWLDQKARKIPQIAMAFQNRHRDPRMVQKWEKYLQKEWASDFGPTIDPVATEDREAVAQAVRGASTKVTADPPPKLGGMSNAEYRKYVREQHGFDPGV